MMRTFFMNEPGSRSSPPGRDAWLRKSWTRLNSRARSARNVSALINWPALPCRSSSRNSGTSRVMPRVALAPAQLCASGGPPRSCLRGLRLPIAQAAGGLVEVKVQPVRADFPGCRPLKSISRSMSTGGLLRRCGAAWSAGAVAGWTDAGGFTVRTPSFDDGAHVFRADGLGRDNRPCRRRGIFRGRLASPGRSWR